MAASVTHAKVSIVADSADTDDVRMSDWNAGHTVSISAADVGAEASGAVATHAAAGDPHPVYETSTEAAAKVTTHAGAADPHGDRAFDTAAIATHAGLADPHTVYFLESAAAAVATSGSASDLGTGTLPIARIADGAVTLAKQANLAESLVIGRAVAAGTGVPVGLTAAQLRTLLGLPAQSASAQADVATSETTTTQTFVDLTTSGPTVTVTIGASGMALVIVSATMSNSNAANSCIMAYSLDADTAVSTRGAMVSNTGAVGASRPARATLETGLSAASHEFKAKYTVGGTTGTFAARRIIVIPL